MVTTVAKATAKWRKEARISLVSGLISLLSLLLTAIATRLGFAICILAGGLAVLYGHSSRFEMKSSEVELRGKGMSMTGLILGYIAVGAVYVRIIIYLIPGPPYPPFFMSR